MEKEQKIGRPALAGHSLFSFSTLRKNLSVKPIRPGVGLNISSRKIPSDVFMWRSFQMLKPSEQEKILNRRCDSRSGICHTTVVPIPTSRIRVSHQARRCAVLQKECRQWNNSSLPIRSSGAARLLAAANERKLAD